MKRRTFVKQVSSAALLTSVTPSTLTSHSRDTGNLDDQKLCIFSKHLQWLDFHDMARLAAEIGFSGIDLTVRNEGHVLPENVKRDLPEAVRQIREAGIEVPMITTGITDPDDPLTHDILETAGKSGIKIYRPGWFRYETGMSVAGTLDFAKKQLVKLQKINQRYNIAASYQNHAGNYVGSSGWDLLQIIEGLEPQWMGVQFDIRHAMVEGYETWPYFLEILAPYINSVDIKDYTWELEEPALVHNVPLGQGLVNFDAFLVKLKSFQVRTDFSIHFEYPLGGAEHGARNLGISKELFIEKARADLDYFKEALHKIKN